MQLKLSDKHVKLITETAVRTALEHLEKQKQEEEKKKYDRRLRNTKLLLVNYKSFKLHCEDIETEISELEDQDNFDFLDVDDLVIESIKRSKRRTLAIVKFIERMLSVYETLAANKPEEHRRYETIKKLYASSEEFTVEDVAKCHNVDVRTVYRDRRGAVKSLSTLVFGVDGVRFY